MPSTVAESTPQSISLIYKPGRAGRASRSRRRARAAPPSSGREVESALLYPTAEVTGVELVGLVQCRALGRREGDRGCFVGHAVVSDFERIGSYLLGGLVEPIVGHVLHEQHAALLDIAHQPG